MTVAEAASPSIAKPRSWPENEVKRRPSLHWGRRWTSKKNLVMGHRGGRRSPMSQLPGSADLDSLSLLERLPRELVWKIIEYVPEAAFELTLTSRILHFRVNEFAVQRVTIPLVESLEITSSSTRSGELTVKLIVSNNTSNLFELRHKHHKRSTDTKCKRLLVPDNPTEYHFKLDLENVDDELFAYLRECIGGRIGRTRLSNCNFRDELSGITAILEGIKFKSLVIRDFSLPIELINALPAIIKDHNVQNVSLSVGEVEVADPVKVLIELSTLVQSMHLHQHVLYRSRNAKLLFGIHNAEWAPIIIEMFSRKLDKLWIENRHFQEYLSKASVDSLGEQLPLLGKGIWFKATCNKYEDGVHYSHNGHTVEADCAGSEDSSLRIIHESRAHETFVSP